MASAALIRMVRERQMKQIQRNRGIGALILLLGVLAWTAVSAIELGEGAPLGLFEAQGTMRYLDLPANIVQIDDKRYRLAQNTIWYGLNAGASLMQQLLQAVNGEVAYIVDAKQKVPTVNAIWILPSEGK